MDHDKPTIPDLRRRWGPHDPAGSRRGPGEAIEAFVADHRAVVLTLCLLFAASPFVALALRSAGLIGPAPQPIAAVSEGEAGAGRPGPASSARWGEPLLGPTATSQPAGRPWGPRAEVDRAPAPRGPTARFGGGAPSSTSTSQPPTTRQPPATRQPPTTTTTATPDDVRPPAELEATSGVGTTPDVAEHPYTTVFNTVPTE